MLTIKKKYDELQQEYKKLEEYTKDIEKELIKLRKEIERLTTNNQEICMLLDEKIRRYEYRRLCKN